MSRFNTGNKIDSDDLKDLSDNAKNMDLAANSDMDTFQDRLGRSRLTWAGIEKAGTGDPAIAVDAAARAEAAASTAEAAADNVEQNAEQIAQDAAQQAVQDVVAGVDGAVDRAEDAASRSETARDAAFVNADVYPDVASGLAAVADGEQFQVAGQRHLVRYVRVSASTAEEVARLANGKSVEEFVGSSYDLLKSHVTNLFQEADLPVRSYTAAGVFKDYAPGYSQDATSGGVWVSVPAQGSGTAKHYLLTREYGGPYAKVRGTFTNITNMESAGVGLGFIDPLGVFRAYLVTSSGNLIEVTDGFTVTTRRTGLGTFAEGASVELTVDGGVLTAKVNGVTWVEHTLPDRAFTGQILAAQAGFSSYTFNLEVEADPVRDYVSGEVQLFVERPELRSDAENLFRWEAVNLFPDANLPVRRYTGADTFNDYSPGYSQTATVEGLLVQIPASGSVAITHYIRTGELNTASKLVASFSMSKAFPASSVGIGYINSSGDYVGYVLSGSGVVRRIEGYVQEQLTEIIAPYTTGAELRYEVDEGSLNIILNGDSVYTVPLSNGEFESELLITQAGFPEYTVSFSYQSDPIRDYVRREVSESSVIPDGFYEFDGTGEFLSYTRVSGSTYVGFRVGREVDMRPHVYQDYWRILNAEFYIYDGNAMVSTGVVALIGGESECVWKRNANKDDFTGGYHGDELVTDFKFFADGIEVDMTTPIPMTPCSASYYLEHSTMHATSEGGVPIEGHPVECYHIKRTEFKEGGYETFNRLTWVAPGLVTLWYHGISCVGKQTALRGYTEALFTPVEFTESGEQKLESVGSREFHAWGAEYSAYVTSRQLLPSAADEASSLFVSDRSSDSKYYRRSAPATVAQGDVWESVMTVKFSAQ